MHRQSCPGTMRLLGIVFAVTTLVSPSAFGQPLRATVVHVEGAKQTWHVTDMHGKIVEVEVPSQSIVDIQTSKEERPGASGTSGQGTGTVLATVVEVDTLTNRVEGVSELWICYPLTEEETHQYGVRGAMITQVLHCSYCHETDIVRHGKSPEGTQRYRCWQCLEGDGRTFLLEDA